MTMGERKLKVEQEKRTAIIADSNNGRSLTEKRTPIMADHSLQLVTIAS